MSEPTRPECGTDKGARIHTARHEKACEPCRAFRRERRNTKAGTRSLVTAEEVIAEIEWFLSLNQGTHHIIKALGYVGKENSLERRLHHHGRGDLAKRLLRPELTEAA